MSTARVWVPRTAALCLPLVRTIRRSRRQGSRGRPGSGMVRLDKRWPALSWFWGGMPIPFTSAAGLGKAVTVGPPTARAVSATRVPPKTPWGRPRTLAPTADVAAPTKLRRIWQPALCRRKERAPDSQPSKADPDLPVRSASRIVPKYRCPAPGRPLLQHVVLGLRPNLMVPPRLRVRSRLAAAPQTAGQDN